MQNVNCICELRFKFKLLIGVRFLFGEVFSLYSQTERIGYSCISLYSTLMRVFNQSKIIVRIDDEKNSSFKHKGIRKGLVLTPLSLICYKNFIT